MAIQTEVWVAHIAKNIFKDNTFMRRSKNDDSLIKDKLVHLPQSGNKPNVVRNRTIIPATVGTRTDTILTYPMVTFTTDPTLIEDVDEIEVSYEKRANVLEEHINELDDSCADYVAYAWTPDLSAQIVDTTGAARPAVSSGATGNRKKITRPDILRAKAILDKQNIKPSNRYLLLDSDMYNDLLGDDAILSKDFMNSANMETGVVDRLYGFDIYVRSNVGRYPAASDTPKDPDALDATDDNAYALAWHSSFVRSAKGMIKVFADENEATLYGSAFSALSRGGASKAYTNSRGIVAIREGAV